MTRGSARRIVLILGIAAALAEIVATFLPWVQYEIPLELTTIAGYADPIRTGIGTGALAVFALFIGAARLASRPLESPASLLVRLSGLGITAVAAISVVLLNYTAHRISGDDVGLQGVALRRAARFVDYSPGNGLALAIGAAAALAVIGCLILLLDNPKVTATQAETPRADAAPADA